MGFNGTVPPKAGIEFGTSSSQDRTCGSVQDASTAEDIVAESATPVTALLGPAPEVAAVPQPAPRPFLRSLLRVGVMVAVTVAAAALGAAIKASSKSQGKSGKPYPERP